MQIVHSCLRFCFVDELLMNAYNLSVLMGCQCIASGLMSYGILAIVH